MKTLKLEHRTSGATKKRYHYLIKSGNGEALFRSPPSGFPTPKERKEAVAHCRSIHTKAEYYQEERTGDVRVRFTWERMTKKGMVTKTAGITTEGYRRRRSAEKAVTLLQHSRLVDKKGKVV